MEALPVESTGAIPTAGDEMADEAFLSVFPDGLPRAQPVAKSAIVGSFPLEVSHLQLLAAHAESGETLGVQASQLKRIRHTHHRLAQLLASGMDETKAAYLCNYDPSTVSILKTDPMFKELLHYYGLQVEETFVDAVQLMADLTVDVLMEMRERLVNAPEELTADNLNKWLAALADRSGHGPTSNVNATLTTISLSPDELARIKGQPEGGNAGQARALTQEDRRLIASPTDRPALPVIIEEIDGEPEAGGGLRGEGLEEAEGDVANAGDPPVDQVLRQERPWRS